MVLLDIMKTRLSYASPAHGSEKTDVEKGNEKVASLSQKDKDTDTNLFNRNLKLLFCFVGLQVSYIAWGVSQEQLMTNEYKLGKFKSASFCVFGNRFFALFISMAIVLYRRMTSTSLMKEAPYHYYAPASLSNTISSWAQYEALKYVSFPTQVLSKSCKVIPVMFVSSDHYLYELFICIISCCIAVMYTYTC